jgi:glycine hydroxymethyltransferase
VLNAQTMAGQLADRGLRIVSGGTDNHLFLVDLSSRDLTGKLVEQSLEKAGITVNKNTIPYDPNPPLVASGIRIGTPAVTTRGMQEPEMTAIADLIVSVLDRPQDEDFLSEVRSQVDALCQRFPLYDPPS